MVQAQYSKIIEELEEFTSDILTCIRDGHEQTTILKKGAGKGLRRDKLARIKLAIHCKHRQARHTLITASLIHAHTCFI